MSKVLRTKTNFSPQGAQPEVLEKLGKDLNYSVNELAFERPNELGCRIEALNEPELKYAVEVK